MKQSIPLKLVFFVSWLWMPIECFAQADGIFGGTEPAPLGFGEPVAAVANPSGLTSSPLEDSHAVVRSLRRNPPQTEIEISRAILYMTRIERWDEVVRYLDQLAKRSIDESMAIKMERAAGLETWFKLSGDAGKLSEPQRAVATKIIDLSSAATRKPATLENAIKLLHSKELVDRKRGVLAIQASGETGLAAMLESVASSDAAPPSIMSETIITMRAEGEAALKAAIATSNSTARERLLLVAARVPGPAYMAELTTALYCITPQSDAYRQISKVLSPSGQALPEADASQRYALNQMQSQLHEFSVFRRETTTGANSVWRWSPDGKRLITELEDTASVHLERAYQLASLVIQLGPQAGGDTSLATAVVLERNHRLLPVLGLEQDAFRKEFQPIAASENLDYLGLVWEAAKKAGLQAAQLRAIQAMSLELPKNPKNASATVRRLSEAVKHSSPPLRYASVVALANRPDLDGGFEGKFAYDQTKQEMLRLESKPLALIVGGSVELRDSLSKHLSQLGVRSLGTASARETLRTIQETQPIEYVFLVDRVLEMSLSELVQRIRAFPRTSSLPLAILTDHVGSTQRAILADEGVQQIHYSSVTSNIDLTAALLKEIQRRSPIPPMDSIDRLLFRSHVEPATK